MNCPKCNKPMTNHGNISGIIYTSDPEQWDDTYACDDCKVKVIKRERGKFPPSTSHLNDYETLGG